jgi:hypothetical protein
MLNLVNKTLQLYKRHVRSRGLNNDKLRLIEFAFSHLGIHSFADLGAVWGVNGGYTFYTLDMFTISRAVMVDTYTTDTVQKQITNYPQLRFIQGFFGDTSVISEVGNAGAIIFFDVLLHQVSPNWDDVLDLYTPNAQHLIIFNPQWVGSEHTIRLIELGENEYFKNVPHSKNEPPYDDLFQKLDDRELRDAINIWQYGITDKDLHAKIERTGFRLQYYANCGRFGNLKNFENHAFVFSR